MPFTAAQLAAQMDNPQLAQWAETTLQTQGPYLAAFRAYFNGIQHWIVVNGGANPFGWSNVTGLQTNAGVQVVLPGPAQRAPFNDAFDDVRKYLGQPSFRLFQAAEAAKRLIGVLNRM